MVKVVGFIRKREDLTFQQFKEYWLNKHSKLEKESLEQNPVKRIVASFVTEELIGKGPFDGMVELYFSSMEDFREQWSGSQDAVMKEDERNFCDPEYRVFVLTEEYIMAEKTPRECKI
jgi:uncharacterized protein (TIGR02118 family)